MAVLERLTILLHQDLGDNSPQHIWSFLMQSINVGWFSRLANALRPLTLGAYEPETALDVLGAARPYLLTLSDKSQFPLHLDASRPLVWALQEQIEAVAQALTGESEIDFTGYRSAIQDNASRLMMVLDTDLGHQPVYCVFPKRAYDIQILTSDATQVFSGAVRAALTEEEEHNIKEAGRCLAFEVPTAAGFHLFRALDSVLQRYVRLVRGSLPRNRNWGQYIKSLEDSGIDRKITGVLFQIKEFHRNPIIHPEARLDVEEALSLVGVAESALSMMVADMDVRRPLELVDPRDELGLEPNDPLPEIIP